MAAGLHPLYALGASTSSPSPISINTPVGSPLGEAIARAGQDVGRAVAAQETAEQREIRALEMEAVRARAQNDFAQASYWDAQTAKLRGMNPPAQSTVHQGTPNVYQPIEGFYDRSRIEAAPVHSRASNAPEAAAASTPFWRTYEIAPGRVIDLPFSEEQPLEGLESVSAQAMWPLVIAQNMRRYGPEWLGEMASILMPFLDKAYGGPFRYGER